MNKVFKYGIAFCEKECKDVYKRQILKSNRHKRKHLLYKKCDRCFFYALPGLSGLGVYCLYIGVSLKKGSG